MKVSIIVPTYKEVENLETLVTSIDSVLNANNTQYEIIIVDDNSGDGTEELIEDLAAQGKPVTLHVRMEERGLGSAVVFGMQKAAGDILICMDADLSHDPEYLPTLIKPFEEESPPEMVIGSRFVKGGDIDDDWSAHRWANSYVATLLSRPLLLKHIADPMAGFFAITSEVFRRSDHIEPIGYKIGLEIMLKCMCNPIREVPIHFKDRNLGSSKLNLKEQLNYLNHLSRLYDFRHPRLSSWLKYIIAVGIGFLASIGVFALLEPLNIPSSSKFVLAYCGAALTSAAFYFRYIRYNRSLINSLHPYWEFCLLIIFEFIGIITILSLMTPGYENSPIRVLFVLAGAGAVIRYLGRKVFGHDVRGPSLLRDRLKAFHYKEKGLTCSVCGSSHFYIPYLLEFPRVLSCADCSVIFNHPCSKTVLGETAHEDRLPASGSMELFKNLQSIRKIKTALFIGRQEKSLIAEAEKMNWELSTQELSSETAADGNYDLVFAGSLLQYEREPNTVIERLKNSMSEETLLVVTTHNSGSRLAQILKENWFTIHPGRNWYFSKQSLFTLLRQQDFQVLSLRKKHAYLSLKTLLVRLKEAPNSMLLRWSCRLLFLALPDAVLEKIFIPLEDQLVAVVQKSVLKPVTRYLKVQLKD